MLLDNTSATVTGDNSGIVNAVVLELARQGAKLVVDYVSHSNVTQELEKQVAALLGEATGLDAHVSKISDLQRLIAATAY